MAGPVDAYIQDGVPVSKSAFRGDDRAAKRRNIQDVSTVQSYDLTGQFAGIYVRSLQANFDLDTSDTTTLHNGTTVLVDGAGNIFKIVLALQPANNLSDVTSAAAALANLGGAAITAVRERLTTNRTYYVRPDGSDGNTGLANSAGGAFLTKQKAINTVAALDISIYDVTIQVADGTYTDTVLVNGPWIGSGNVILQGNASAPANVVFSVTGANTHPVSVRNGGRLRVRNFKVQNAGGGGNYGQGLYASSFGGIQIIGPMHFGAMGTSGGFINATEHGLVWATYGAASMVISGGCNVGIGAAGNSRIALQGMSVTITGTPAWGTAFVYGEGASSVQLDSLTKSGSSTGSRFLLVGCSFLQTYGGQALVSTDFLPGSTNGSAATGGQFA